MTRLIALVLLCGCFGRLWADQVPPLTEEERGVITVLKVFLRENKDPKAVKIGAQVFKYAAELRGKEEQARTGYAQAVKNNGGYKLDVDSVQRLANEGNAMAQLKLAIGYAVDQNSEEGIYGLPRDDGQFTLWATKAALNGMARAQWILTMKKDASFDQTIYWLIRAAAHGSERSYQHAAMTIKLKANLNNATPAQLQDVSDFQKRLTPTEALAANSLTLLDNLRRGKSTWGDRTLTPEESETARKYFGN